MISAEVSCNQDLRVEHKHFLKLLYNPFFKSFFYIYKELLTAVTVFTCMQLDSSRKVQQLVELVGLSPRKNCVSTKTKRGKRGPLL